MADVLCSATFFYKYVEGEIKQECFLLVFFEKTKYNIVNRLER